MLDKKRILLRELDGQWRHLGDMHLNRFGMGGARFWIKPAQQLREAGLAESKLIHESRGLCWRLTAQGTEAQRATTGPVAESDAP